MSFRSGFVSVIGRPNVGKSTLINRLIGEKISIISPRPQTTRNRIHAVCTREQGQIVFVDTPGIYIPRDELDEYMVDQAYRSLKGIDVILFIVDGNSSIRKGDRVIYQQLKGAKPPLLIVMNKIDRVKGDLLQKRQQQYSREFNREVMPISAREGHNLELLEKEVFARLPEGPQYYPEDMITDRIERFIVAEIIREKIFYLLREEVPYGVAVVIEEFKTRDKGNIYLRANIYVEQKSHKGIVIGKNGSMLKKIGQQARQDIEDLLQTDTYLDLWVKVKQDWREDKQFLKRLGYKE